ncbi:MAG: hypothetical protein BAJALOKI2v1_290037 [Promethearchaeota archaeon]|nr:MAG: hypothetical protein BAJALOKI2v1_290037 [Candidatus Lokiarchaeota archaeon]
MLKFHVKFHVIFFFVKYKKEFFLSLIDQRGIFTLKNSEENVFFYIDLAKDILKRKYITKAIENYIEEKNKKYEGGLFGLLIFQKDGTPVFIKGKKDAEIIVNALEENWKNRPKDQSFFENGLFYLFSYIADTVRKKAQQYRIIIITDTPSDLNESYQEALFDLVSKIKHFPTFIDVIRVSEEGKRFFKDDVKLNILTSDTKGGIFYIHGKRELYKIIDKLVKQKELINTFTDQPDEFKISKEDYYFYNNLASELKKKYPVENLICYFCHEEICPVCTDVHDIPKICNECGSAFHNCCAINYTIDHNIGIPHIFRCPNCQSMLKIPEEEIVSVSPEISEEASVEEYMKMEEESRLTEEERQGELSIDEMEEEILLEDIDSDDLMTSRSKPQKEESHIGSEERKEKVRHVRVGGYFGKVFTVKKVGDEIIYERSDRKTVSKKNNDETIRLEKRVEISGKQRYWKPSSPQKEMKSKVRICPMCGVQISDPNQRFCSNCGNQL